YWESPATLPGGGEVVLVLQFDKTVDVDKAIIRSGVSDNFQSTNRPQALHIVYNTGATFDVTLKDSPDPQEVGIGNGHGITTMEIHITQLYKAVRSNAVAVTEIGVSGREWGAGPSRGGASRSAGGAPGGGPPPPPRPPRRGPPGRRPGPAGRPAAAARPPWSSRSPGQPPPAGP